MRATRTGLAALLAGALLLTACGDDAGDVEVGEGDDVAAEDAQADGTEDATGDEADPADDTSTVDETSPSPDAVALEDPCAEHEGRQDDVFIDLVAPVNEQVVSGEVDIVGCSNVFEGTIQWRLLDGDGATLEEGFTTAECGTGCVGAFRDTLPVSAVAEEQDPALQSVQLQVYWESPAEGEGERDLVERIVVLE